MDLRLGDDAVRLSGLVKLLRLVELEPESFELVFSAAMGPTFLLASRNGLEERFDDVLRLGVERVLSSMLSCLVNPEQLSESLLELAQQVIDLGRQDQQTGLLNRKELELRLTEERARAQRTKSALALLLIGLDDLPPHHRDGEPGDSLLRSLGGLLRQELRSLDTAARFDEQALAVVLPQAGALEAAEVAQRIGKAAEARELSISIGVAAFPDDCDHPDDLVRLSGKHLAAARDSGGGRACLSEDGEPIVFSEEG